MSERKKLTVGELLDYLQQENVTRDMEVWVSSGGASGNATGVERLVAPVDGVIVVSD